MEDIHGKDVSQLVANNSELINNNRAIFESNNFITEMIKQLEKEADDDDDDVDECEEDLEIETTDKYLIQQQEEKHCQRHNGPEG